MGYRLLANVALFALALAFVSPTTSADAAPVVPVVWNELAAAPNALTVTTAQSAVISLEGPALAAAGWPVAQIAPQTVQVWRNGVEIPAYVTADSNGGLAAVRFQADGNESIFSREAVYWLTYGRGQGQRLLASPTGSTALRWEEDQTYDSMVASLRGDGWFAFELRPGDDPRSIPVTLPAPLPAGASLQVSVAPALRRSGHELELRYNGQRIGLARWDDGAVAVPRLLDVTLERPLPAGAVTLEAALISAGTDRVLLDDLIFPSLQQPLPTLSPAPSPVSPRDLRAGPAAGQAGASYLIITHASLQPALAPLVALKQAQGDTVGVVDVQWAYDAFSYGERDPSAIRALIATAVAQWMPPPRAVLLVGAGTVRMRGGEVRPPTPGLVLSDSPVSDPLIPPYLVRGIDPSGEIACDTCYTRLDAADVRDDTLPNLPIGRIPARTLDEARTVVSKTVGHATPPPGSWRSRALMVADNDVQPTGVTDPAGPFSPVIRDATALLPRGMQVRQFIYAPQPSAPAGTYANTGELRCRLFRAWDGGSQRDTACPPLAAGEEPGASLLVYVGHGSPWQWAHTSSDAATPYLFYLYDADGRKNAQRLPIVLSMTCFSGNWANPIMQSLDERLLVMPTGGSVAAFTAVGSGVNTAHGRLLAALLPVLTAAEGPRSLGAAHLAALGQLGAASRDLAYSFHVLGDPDVTLPPLARHATFLPSLMR
ncbi:C25 family cysteine peptidase [Chloroflexus sp.]|uniref:C25 family cysteine peptidase n=1 Tax=Chloroflexus sp. TaxID=1904827 RepID=UPI002ACEA564|nr:C25 family cysteine peptidase [Chloroflexus sp.]